MKSADKHSLTAECPYPSCRAKPGEWCKDFLGGTAKRVHAVRKRVAQGLPPATYGTCGLHVPSEDAQRRILDGIADECPECCGAATMNPAAELREAAKLMRERAAEAEKPGYDSTHPGKPWCPAWTYSVVRHVNRNMDSECSEHPWGSESEGDCNQWGRHAGYHIAGMHPAFAVAVAEWLDEVAADSHASLPAWVESGALKIARAYLGESATDA
jgi:hypothetical protein